LVFKIKVARSLQGVVKSNALSIAKDIIPEKEKYKPEILQITQVAVRYKNITA